ncbi:hypothetical protein SAMN04488564_112208 [Lentzea waywayandensis]|uniref:Uncharacterized protein n=1 Tax=Lentzea waywayandensis TaxID=84724 RepID=A0A1I6FEB7_9PSEU|nr:hypothetical protein [Lentzea waywayandensis]SFR28097.1 hypothetical protein SAMN04488564_112208 [Lentzea waywayandensis]
MNRTQVTAVITRGLTKDYGYLGVPGDEWWAEAAGFVDMDEPAVIALRDDNGLRVLVSGIPSARRDTSHRLIRVTLVLAGDDRPDVLRALVRAVLDDGDRDNAGVQLDAVLTGPVVEELLGDRTRPIGELGDAVLDALEPLSSAETGAGPRQDRPGSWVGAVHDEESTARFLGRFDALLAGKADGHALATHQVVSTEGAARAEAALGAGTAVLTLSEQSTVTGVTRLGKAGRPDPRPATKPPTSKVVAVVAILVLVVALVLWLR